MLGSADTLHVSVAFNLRIAGRYPSKNLPAPNNLLALPLNFPSQKQEGKLEIATFDNFPELGSSVVLQASSFTTGVPSFMEPGCLTLWLCRIADTWLDGFALLAVLRTSQATREPAISRWRQKTLDAAATFRAADMFFRRAIHEGAIDIPGFGAEDLPFEGRVMPLMKPGDRLSNGRNLSLLYTLPPEESEQAT